MVAEVSCIIGMGRHGAELAIFQYEGTDAQFLRVFDEFVKYEVSEKYKVTQCADVPGFQTPEVYR